MKNAIIIIFTTFFCACSSNVPEKDYNFENNALKCGIQEFKKIGVDIVQELNKYEAYLIEEGILKSKSGKSYKNFINKSIKKDTLVLPCMYKADSLINENFKFLWHCFRRLELNKSQKYIESKAHKLNKAIDSLSITNNVKEFTILQAISSVADTTDFSNDFYRLYSLQLCYHKEAYDIYKIQDAKKPKIFLSIYYEKDIKVNGVQVKIEELKEKLMVETEKFTEEDKKELIIKLKVEKNVKMGVVTDVKKILREVGLLKINYSTMETRVPFI